MKKRKTDLENVPELITKEMLDTLNKYERGDAKRAYQKWVKVVRQKDKRQANTEYARKMKFIREQISEVKQMEITKEQFEKYEEIRKNGSTNMYDISRVVQLSGLDREIIQEINKYYGKLLFKYPSVRRD